MQTESTRISRHALAAALLAALGLCAAGLTGCSTMEGAGEDIEHVGEGVSGASRDVQD
jgi:predicted small secreted protein